MAAANPLPSSIKTIKITSTKYNAIGRRESTFAESQQTGDQS